jgi:uncharacterized Zn finger protein (UPF0148 family)
MHLPPYERENMTRALRRLGFSSYASYLRSGLWETSRRRLMRSACENCDSRAGLVLHHMTYANLGAERMDEVCTLCSSCHVAVHRAAGRGGTLYPDRVMARRAQRPPREKKIGALEVACPVCGAMPTHRCRLPSGHVRGREHSERRAKADGRSKRIGSRRRSRAKRGKARAARMSVERLDRISAARDAEFPLEALRAIDDELDQALRRD